jgi:hypothetical protein
MSQSHQPNERKNRKPELHVWYCKGCRKVDPIYTSQVVPPPFKTIIAQFAFPLFEFDLTPVYLTRPSLYRWTWWIEKVGGGCPTAWWLSPSKVLVLVFTQQNESNTVFLWFTRDFISVTHMITNCRNIHQKNLIFIYCYSWAAAFSLQWESLTISLKRIGTPKIARTPGRKTALATVDLKDRLGGLFTVSSL